TRLKEGSRTTATWPSEPWSSPSPSSTAMPRSTPGAASSSRLSIPSSQSTPTPSKPAALPKKTADEGERGWPLDALRTLRHQRQRRGCLTVAVRPQPEYPASAVDGGGLRCGEVVTLEEVI